MVVIFTKWAEAMLLEDITSETLTKVFQQKLVHSLDAPEQLNNDQGQISMAIWFRSYVS